MFTIYFISVDYLRLDFRNLTSINLKGSVYRGSYYDEDDEIEDRDQVGSVDEIMDALRKLIHNNPGLKRWTIHEPVPQLRHEVWEALAYPTKSQYNQQEHIMTATTKTTTDLTGPRLDVLDISFITIDHKSAPFFLVACRTAKTLRLSCCTVQGLRDSRTRLLCKKLPAHADGPYFPQSVKFTDIIGLSVLARLVFLARCSNVQKIHWQSTTRSSHYAKHYHLLERDEGISVNQPLPSTDDIRQFIQPGTWMHLQSLVVSGLYDPYYGNVLEFIQDEGFAHILEAIPAL